MKEKFQLVIIKDNYGFHTDVYVDFENQILQHTGWKAVKAANKYLQRLYNVCILPKLKYRQFNFNRLLFNPEKYLFALISGTQYSKIFLKYSFKARFKAIYMFDPWPDANKLNENAIRSYKINIAFMSAKQPIDYFNSLEIKGFKAYWIPEGVDSNKYIYYNYDDKNIDIIQYGRQWDWLHNKIEPLIEEEKIKYEFPTKDNNHNLKLKSRALFVETLAKSKIAICVPRQITHPHHVGNLATLTTRYFECMSSKCLIWGTAPQELIELFGYNPVIEIDLNKPEEQLLDLINNYKSYIPLIEKNYQNVIQNHQWKNRIDDMLKILSFSNIA